MNKRLINLDILRGVSFIIVFLYHLEIPLFSFGYLGVDVFFVLSGFLMHYIYYESFTKNQVINYYAKRFFRVIPAYLVVNILSFIISIFILLPHELNFVFIKSIFNSLYIPNFGYFIDATYFDNQFFRPLLNFWSLGVEIQFYLIFPFLILILKRKHFNYIPIILVITLVLTIIFSYVNEKITFFMMPLRIWEFFAGFMVSTSIKFYSKKDVQFPLYMFKILFLMFIFSLVSLDFFDLKPSIFLNIFIVSVSCFCIFFAVLSKEINYRLYLDRVGVYSYSLYLVHFPIICFLNYSPFKGTLFGFSFENTLWSIILTIFSGILLFNLVENKYRKPKNIFWILILSLLSVLLTTLLYLGSSYIQKQNMSEFEYNVSMSVKDKDLYRTGYLKRLKQPLGELCKMSNNQSDMRILLLGNSHADDLTPIFDFFAKKNKLDYFISKNNFRFPGSEFDNIKQEIVDKNINHLIISSNVELNFEDLNDLIQLKEFSSKNNIKVFIIKTRPVYKESIPSMVLNGNNDVINSNGRLLIKNKKYFKEKDEFKMFFNNPLLKDSFHLLFLDDIFCKGINCEVGLESGKLFYHDESHFTTLGAKKLIKFFENKLFY